MTDYPHFSLTLLVGLDDLLFHVVESDTFFGLLDYVYLCICVSSEAQMQHFHDTYPFVIFRGKLEIKLCLQNVQYKALRTSCEHERNHWMSQVITYKVKR